MSLTGTVTCSKLALSNPVPEADGRSNCDSMAEKALSITHKGSFRVHFQVLLAYLPLYRIHPERNSNHRPQAFSIVNATTVKKYYLCLQGL